MTKSIAKTVGAFKRFLPKYAYALVMVPWLLTAGVFSKRHRFFIFQIAKHFGMRMPLEDERLPVVPLASIWEGTLNLTLLEPLAEAGNVSLLELLVIARFAQEAATKTAFEIGTFDGRTTLNIAANLTSAGAVYTLDLPKEELSDIKFDLAPGESVFVDKHQSGKKFSGTVFSNQITQLYGDSAAFDFSDYEGRMGLVFVDGSHAYENVRRDTATALRLAANNAFILWHDYQQDWPGVIRALNEVKDTDPSCARLSRIEGTSLVMLRCENTRRSS